MLLNHPDGKVGMLYATKSEVYRAARPVRLKLRDANRHGRYCGTALTFRHSAVCTHLLCWLKMGDATHRQAERSLPNLQAAPYKGKTLSFAAGLCHAK